MEETPRIDETCELDDKLPKDKLLSLLDRLEAHVERLRKDTLQLEEKRDTLFTSLDAIRNSELIEDLQETDRDDIQRYIDRVTMRCTTVEILVRTDRDQLQEDSLFQVNHLIDSLVIGFKNDPIGTRGKCQSYIAACTSQSDFPVDKVFESALLGCALDDQKKIKKRLNGLYSYLEHAGKIIPMPED